MLLPSFIDQYKLNWVMFFKDFRDLQMQIEFVEAFFQFLVSGSLKNRRIHAILKLYFLFISHLDFINK